jgi:dTDP-4-amino-4,6-dideoxygalactose transaminase
LLPAETDRQTVIDGLRKRGVQTTVHYPPVHRLTFYNDVCPNCHLARTEDFARRELTLPLHPQMSPAIVELVVNSLAESLSAEVPIEVSA